MTRPNTNTAAGAGTASWHTRSPFTGLDVCAQAGLPIRPGGRTVLFTDDLWSFTDVEHLPVQMNRAIGRWDFTTISNRRWRLTAKEYLFARLVPRHEDVSVLPHAYRVPLTLTTCSKQMNELVRWLNWLNTQVTSLDQVSQEHLRPLPHRTRHPLRSRRHQDRNVGAGRRPQRRRGHHRTCPLW